MGFSYKTYCREIFSISSYQEFRKLALDAFLYQYNENEIYNKYCNYLNINPKKIGDILDIPFMPIEFFKTHKVISGDGRPEETFTSSGTTGVQTSKHYIVDTELYKESFLRSFIKFYGNIEQYKIIGLLPSYLERQDSSLVFMVNELMNISKQKDKLFFLNDYDKLFERIKFFEETNSKYLLFGVSFALLDFAKFVDIPMQHGIIMETGGMKGRRKEIIRNELHNSLKHSFGVANIHSEYGMTELLSQAYSQGDGIYKTPAWMKLLVRDTNDPLSVKDIGKGAINIIDLANINSCCFLATSDLGEIYSDATFQISGRFDQADVRGCNLLVY